MQCKDKWGIFTIILYLYQVHPPPTPYSTNDVIENLWRTSDTDRVFTSMSWGVIFISFFSGSKELWLPVLTTYRRSLVPGIIHVTDSFMQSFDLFSMLFHVSGCMTRKTKRSLAIVSLQYVLDKHSAKSPSVCFSQNWSFSNNCICLLIFCCWRLADLMVHSGGRFLFKSWPGSLDLNLLSKTLYLFHSASRSWRFSLPHITTQQFFPDSGETKYV